MTTTHNFPSQPAARRNDIIDLMIDEVKAAEEASNRDGGDGPLDAEAFLISNALLFFFAGTETTSMGIALVRNLSKSKESPY